MKKFFIKLIICNNITANNSEKPNKLLINSYFNSDKTRKTNNINDLKYFIIIPVLLYLSIILIFPIVYFIFKKKLVISFWFLEDYFNYKINKYNEKYLY